MARPRTGSVQWSDRRKAYRAQLDWVDAEGERHQRKRYFSSKSEGNDLVKKWIRDLDQQGAAYLDAERITFQQLADEYKEQRLIAPVYRNEKKVKGLRDWKSARRRLKKLTDHFGKRRIRTITYTDIEKFRNELIDTPVVIRKRDGTVISSRERSIGDVHRVLALAKTVFNYAVQKEWLNRNPFSKGEALIVLAQEVPRDRVYSTDEQRRLLQACQNKDRRHIYRSF